MRHGEEVKIRRTRGDFAAIADHLSRMDSNHVSAMSLAADREGYRPRRWVCLYDHMPEMVMPSEYIPGRWKLMQSADPNDGAAVEEYISASLNLLWDGPIGMMPLHIAYRWMMHDDTRAKRSRANEKLHQGR